MELIPKPFVPVKKDSDPMEINKESAVGFTIVKDFLLKLAE